jgi:hypothetical protein
MEGPCQKRHSFLLRIWWDEPYLWRGWVQHIGSLETLNFKNISDLVNFIQKFSGVTSGGSVDLHYLQDHENTEDSSG